MASNDLLPIGSIGIDDYLNEIAAIANVNAAQLLEYDEKEFENLGKKFGKLIFHRIAQKRMIMMINDADTFENAFGIGSLPTIKLVVEDIKKIAEIIKNIETEVIKII